MVLRGGGKMKPAKTLSKGLYMTDRGNIVALECVEIYENVKNDTTGEFTDVAALVVWVDERGRYPKTMIRGDQFSMFYRLGSL